MELRHLKYFVAVAEELHFTRAAERLHISQPPLTQQIKAFEEEIGTQLFVRNPRAIELTDAGRVLLAEATAILADVQTAVMRTRQAANGIVGHVSVGFTEAAMFNSQITGIMGRFRSAYPLIELRLSESFSPDLIEQVQDNKLQVALVRPPNGLPAELVYTELLREERVVVLPLDHPLARRESVELEALAEEPFIIYPRVIPAGFEGPLGARFAPRIHQQAPRISSTVNLVAAGLGIAIVPESVRQMGTPGVRYVPVRGSLPPAILGIVYRRSESSRTARNLVAMALEAAAPAGVAAEVES